MKKIYLLLVALMSAVTVAEAQVPNWQWAKSTGGAADEIGYSVVTDASGNVFVTGSFMSPTVTFGNITVTNTNSFGFANNVFVTKYDASGNAIWAKGFGGTTAYNGGGIAKGIDLDANGNIYITGIFFGDGMTFGNTTLANTDTNQFSMGQIFITKLNETGDVIWAKSAGGGINDGPNAISVDANSNVLITGYFCSKTIKFDDITVTSPYNSEIYFYDIFIAKYDADGNAIWAKSEGTTANENSTSIETDTNGNFFITGIYYYPSITFGDITLTATAAYNMFVVKYDASGTVVWAKTAQASGPGSINHTTTDLCTDQDGNVFITGTFIATTLVIGNITLNNIGSGTDFFIAKFDASGEVVWAYNAGDNSCTAYGNAIDADANGNVYVTGYFEGSIITFGTEILTNNNTSGYNTDILIAKYNAGGTLLWAKSVGGMYFEIPNGIHVDQGGNAIITGEYTSATVAFGETMITNSQVSVKEMFVAKLGNAVGVVENLAMTDVNLYPNPGKGWLNIKSDKPMTQIEIFNILGEQIVVEAQQTNEALIDLSGYPKGIYTIRMQMEDQNIVSKQIIVR
jgi:hypothetical protein